MYTRMDRMDASSSSSSIATLLLLCDDAPLPGEARLARRGELEATTEIDVRGAVDMVDNSIVLINGIQ